MSRPCVMVCLGTRPEAIKLGPVIAALRADPGLDVCAVSTGQHREMLDQVVDVLGIQIDVELGLMQPSQAPEAFTARALVALGEVVADRRPAAVLVQGDTATTLSGALAAFYQQVPIGHVEAGLRTGDLARPFPEEGTRSMIGRIARWHFCATDGNRANLLREGIHDDAIEVTGSTVIDALLATAARPLPAGGEQLLPPKQAATRILVTMHRRETHGSGQLALCEAIAQVAERGDVEVVLPMHLSPVVRESVQAKPGGRDRVHLLDPLDYHTFVHALRDADIVLTDSGGVQEEAPSFGVPVLVMRDTTERPEGVDAGCVRLSGTSPEAVKADLEQLLDDRDAYDAMSQAANPYGDGLASGRIVARLARDLPLAAGGGDGRDA
ncbi:UDP-N-acetylglucosamine 2-epimerase [Paraconexibacter sp. AEG42_29]|uniref:UDP-N-acetylglucosamine 2-epimerase (non-hydrolyzing) n=1 Tax=Paraconexibacter sp. AEG42_29 TaxID=2997339 RepID=A0AAU7AYX9_9ACTN